MPEDRRFTSRTRFLSVAAVAAIALGTVACSGGDGAPAQGGGTPADSEQTVDATLKDFSITLVPTSAPAGATAFEIANEGPSEHEVEIFKGEADPKSIKVESGVANMEGFELITEAEGIVPGTTRTLSADLDAGSYVVLCNLPGHFEQGMSASFTVE